jgi:hypothetical protein
MIRIFGCVKCTSLRLFMLHSAIDGNLRPWIVSCMCVSGEIFKANYETQKHANESLYLDAIYTACLFVPPSKVQQSQGRSNC